MNKYISRAEPGFCSMFHAERICCYLMFFFGFVGQTIFTIDFGIFQLFLYRFFLVLLWVLFAARTLIQGKVTLPQGRIKLVLGFFGIWLVYSVMSLGWAASKSDAIRHVVILFMSISLIFFATYYFKRNQDLRNLYMIWFGVFCSFILLGFWEHLTGHHLASSLYFGETRSWLMYCPTGVFYNPNDYATFLAISISIALALIKYGKSTQIQIAGFGAMAAAIYLIIVIGSRANILAMMLELAFSFFLLTTLRQKIKITTAILVLIGICLVIMPNIVQGLFSTFALQLSSIDTQVRLDSGSIAIRANLVLNGLEFLYSTAGFGVGAGNAEYWIANFARYDTEGIINLHNWWLEILVNYGVIIFAGYVAMYLWLIWSLWHNLKTARDSWERMIGEALLVAFVGFALASISSSSIMGFIPCWMLLAFIMAFLNQMHRPTMVDII